MKKNLFQILNPVIEENKLLRIPQREAYSSLTNYVKAQSEQREIGIVLPVGCGKSGCITLAPFAFKSIRTLVVAPNLNIAKQLVSDFDPTNSKMFYQKCSILTTTEYPEPVEIRGTESNRSDLDDADVVITNIHQLQGDENRWLNNLPQDYFDLILFDEGHHSVASTWQNLKNHFPNAYIVNYSATPLRSDGQLMAGEVIYSFPVARAIQEGYIKRLKALVLNPKTLKYVRNEDGREIEVPLEEVIRLGEEDAQFRRSIVTSQETLITIVDASIRELDRIIEETGEKRHKIIASALNYEHCRQIVEAYRQRGRKAEYIHSREDSKENDRVYKLLDNHEIEVIVQVRKLGEGFDHVFLSVAAVFSVFQNLSPFVQFVGRIMRVIKQNAPHDIVNQGTVIFHAGSNIASRWSDFKNYSEADQEYFDQLLPLDELDFSDRSEIEITPRVDATINEISIKAQSGVSIEELKLIDSDEDPEAIRAIEYLKNKGYSPEQVKRTMELQPVPTTKVMKRQAARSSLDVRVKNEVGKILGEHNLNHEGRELDKQRLNKSNFVVLKSAIDREINSSVGKKSGERHEFSKDELEVIDKHFNAIISKVKGEFFNA